MKRSYSMVEWGAFEEACLSVFVGAPWKTE